MKRMASILPVVFFVSGCSSVPIPVENDISKISITKPELPIEEYGSKQAVFKTMQRHSELYSTAAYNKRRKALIANETTFYSSLVGVIGGLTKSLSTVVVGGAGAAGSTLYSDRYKLEIQALNYEGAADAMDCMIQVSVPLQSEDLARYEYAIPSTMVSIQADAHIRQVGADGVWKIRKKLEKLQTRLELGKPEFSKFKEAFSQIQGFAKQNGKPQVEGMMEIDDSKDNTYSHLIGEYKTQIDTCIAAFSG